MLVSTNLWCGEGGVRGASTFRGKADMNTRRHMGGI